MALKRHVHVIATILVLILPYGTFVLQDDSLTEFLFPRNGASPLFRAFVERFAPHVPQDTMGCMESLCRGNTSTFAESLFPELFTNTPLHLINNATGDWFPLTHHLSELIPNASDPSNGLLWLLDDFGGAFGDVMDVDVGYFPCLDNESFVDIDLIATAFPDPPPCDPLGTVRKRSIRSSGLGDLLRNILKRQDKQKKTRKPTTPPPPTSTTTPGLPLSTEQAYTCDITKDSIEDIFNDIDTNNDGFLTEDELIAALEEDGIVITDAVREQLRREIRIIDKNGDGKLSLQEMKDALKKKTMPCGTSDLIAGMARTFLSPAESTQPAVTCEATVDQLQPLYGVAFDADQDGLSYSEMQQVFVNHGVSLNANQLSTLRTEIEVGDTSDDGKINADELVEMLNHATMISSCHLSTIAMMVALVPLNVVAEPLPTVTTIPATTGVTTPPNVITGNISPEDITCLFDTYDSDRDGRLSLSELLAALHASGYTITGTFIAEFQNEMLVLDINQDGYLTPDELPQIIQDIAEQCSGGTSPTPTGPTVLVCNLNADQLQDLFDEYDTNNDGKLSEQELVDALVKRGVDVTDAVREQLRKEIDLVDTDGDGKISLEELKAALKKYSHLCDQTTVDTLVGTTTAAPTMFCGVGADQLEDLFDEYDTNNDGKLSEQELVDALEKRGVDVTDAVREQLRKEIDLVDTDGDGKISQEELKAALKKYSQLCDGTIIPSSSTVSPACEIAESRLQELFDSYDSIPQDSYLTLVELLQALAKQNVIITSDVVGEIQREIQLIDTTGDNQITIDELRASFEQYSQLCQGRIIGTVSPTVITTTSLAVAAICGITDDALASLFQSYDTNNDDNLSIDELIPPLIARGVPITATTLQQLDTERELIDTDGDQQISLSELKSALTLHSELCDGMIISSDYTVTETQTSSTTTSTTTSTMTTALTTACDPYPDDWRNLISDWFDYYDTNFYSVLNLAEITRVIEDDGVVFEDEDGTLEVLESELQWMDPERDGVTLDELVAALITYHEKKRENEDDVTKCFKGIDTNGDGKWSEAEIIAFWMKIGVTITEDVKKKIKQHIKDTDKDGDGKISEQEFRDALAKEKKKKEDAIKKRFNEIDTNGDGKLSEAEILAFWKKLGVPITPALRKLVKDKQTEADKDGDGKLSEKEFRDALERERKKNEEEACKKRFKEVDKNGDGKWSEEEVIDALKKAGITVTEAVKKKVKKDIKDADKDGDGKISEQEYKDLLEKEKKKNEEVKKKFKELDKNGDGKIDKDEILEGLKKKGINITDAIRKAVEKEIEKLDEDKDGKLSEEEMIKGLKEASEQEEDDIKKRFKEMDTNKDGKIDEDELAKERIDEIRKQAQKEIKEVDKDGDGKISEQEVRDALNKQKEKENDDVKKGFEQADEDNDGEGDNFITEEEIIKGLEARGVEITDEVRAKVKKLFKEMDVNPKDGKISETEYREQLERDKKKKEDAEDSFHQQYDADSDCFLSADELEVAINDTCAAGLPACVTLQDILDHINSSIVQVIGVVVGETERFFRQYDTDQDGRLKISELIAAWASKGLPVTMALIQRLGREIIMADQNGDRELCLKEVIDYLGYLARSSPFHICPDFESYDTEVDNVLSEQEILQALGNNGKNITHDVEDHVTYQILLFDSDKDGVMSRSELMAAVQWDRETGLLAQYQRFDVNNTGGISEDDIMHTLSESSIVVPASDRAKISDEFATVDMDGNDVISLEEFVNALNRDKAADIEEKFNETDANQDGELSALELVLALIEEGRVITAELIRQLQREIDLIDTDGNKCLSLAELKAVLCSAWTLSLSLSCYTVVFLAVIYTSRPIWEVE